jgi:excisionase family DNA binding protein
MVDEVANMVSVNKAAELTGYSVTYIRKLARDGQIKAAQWGRAWMIDKVDLLAFKEKMESMGSEKHNPWRDDLGKRGRSGQ